MNEQRDIPLWVSLPFIGFMIIKWFMVGLIRYIAIFRRTILWMIAATVAVYMGKPALIGLVIFAIITGIIAWVKLSAVIRSIGNKFANKNEKVSEVFNKIADVVEKVYPTLRKIVRFFSFVPDFQRFGKLVQRNVALAKGNAFMKNIGVIPRNMGFWYNRKKYSIYKVKEHNGEIVKDNKETMGNQVIYLGDERKYPELPLFNNITIDDIVEAAENKIGSVMTDIEPNSHFMGTPAARFEFISNIDNAILKGNQFLLDEGIINENDNNLYDVEVVDEEAGITVFVNEKINNNISDTINKFKKAAENNSVKYLDIQQDGNKLVVKYFFNVDPQVDRANDLLRNLGVIQRDDKTMYDTYMFDNSAGNPTIVINKQIGYELPETVYNKLVGVRSNYGSKYVDLKQKNSESDPWMTFEYVRTVDADISRAHDLLREVKILGQDNAEIYNISLTETDKEAIFMLNEFIPGVQTKSIVQAVEGYKDRFGARSVRSRYLDNGKVEITFIIQDFLDEGKQITEFNSLDVEKMRIECALDAYGNPVYVDLKQKSGILFAGVPGSGKTAAIASFSGAMVLSKDYVDTTIIDCKGADDWTAYQLTADKFIKGSDDREVEIADYFDSVLEEMEYRRENLRKKTGSANFWNATADRRKQGGMKLKYIIVDECQKLFPIDFKAQRGNEEDAKKLDAFNRIKNATTIIVKEGRSLGFCLLLITQRPTADSVPMGIRNNTTWSASLRLKDPNDAKYIFGEIPGFGDPNPADIPGNRPGGAVLKDADDNYAEVRFYYIDDNDLRRLLAPKGKDPDRQEKIKLVKKLLAMAEDIHGYDEEREVAWSKADRLMAEYGITADDIAKA